MPRGAWTDDTAMALLLAESLLVREGFDAHDQVQRFARWQREGYGSSTGQCVGISASVARALATAQYKQQPFSPAEQTAYGNLGNMYDFINANASGLMSGFNANASGQNQFSRNNPRKGLIGNSYDPATSPVAWAPGLLGSFGTKR